MWKFVISLKIFYSTTILKKRVRLKGVVIFQIVFFCSTMFSWQWAWVWIWWNRKTPRTWLEIENHNMTHDETMEEGYLESIYSSKNPRPIKNILNPSRLHIKKENFLMCTVYQENLDNVRDISNQLIYYSWYLLSIEK